LFYFTLDDLKKVEAERKLAERAEEKDAAKKENTDHAQSQPKPDFVLTVPRGSKNPDHSGR
jgi:hypothetical protein